MKFLWKCFWCAVFRGVWSVSLKNDVSAQPDNGWTRILDSAEDLL